MKEVNINSNMKNMFKLKVLQKIIVMILIISIISSIVIPKNVMASEDLDNIFDEDITFERNYFAADGDIMAYSEIIPSTAKNSKSIPLIVWLHGDGGFGSGYNWATTLFHHVVMDEKITLKKFNAYILAPHGRGYWIENESGVKRLAEARGYRVSFNFNRKFCERERKY